jgi:hypothetical protein
MMDRFDTNETCYSCKRTFAAIEWKNGGNTIDTAGGIHFDAGWKCDDCLGGDAKEHSLTARLLNRGSA